MKEYVRSIKCNVKINNNLIFFIAKNQTDDINTIYEKKFLQILRNFKIRENKIEKKSIYILFIKIKTDKNIKIYS